MRNPAPSRFPAFGAVLSRGLGRRLGVCLAGVVLALGGATLRASSNYLTPPWALDTYAGYTGVGRDDGAALAASFDGPAGVAVDGAGNIYVADTFNSAIRKLTPAGQVSTHAGSPGVAGVLDGAGNGARFNYPGGLVAAADGTLYIADTGNHLIRRVSSAGLVSTLAGAAGQTGATDATGASARFKSPAALALDATTGVLYVADTGNHTIRRLVIDTGVVTTLAGTAVTTGSTVNATGTAARFDGPVALALSADRTQLYVADFEGHTVRRVTVATGLVTTLAGSPDVTGSADGTGANARFDKPQGLAISPAGDILVADTNGCRIRQLTTAGVVTTLAGGYLLPGSVDSNGVAARFNQPQGLAYDLVAGRLVVADALNAQIRSLDLSSLVVATIAGRQVSAGTADGVSTIARFRDPWGVARDSAGNLYVADRGNHTLRKITPTGAVTTLAGLAGAAGSVEGTGANARFNEPSGVAVLGDGSVIYVADFATGSVRRVTSAGAVTTLASGFSQPTGLALDASGNLYVAEFGAHAIRRVTPAGVVSLYAGSSGTSGSAGGDRLSAAQFFQPFGLAADSSGNLYVADFGNQTVRKITAATGVVSVVAGAAGQSGSVDDAAGAARFFYPSGVAVDSSGVLYVSDYANQLVRRIAIDGAVRTFVGTTATPGGVDGIAGAGRLRNPRGIAVNPSTGEFFVADAGNNAVRYGAPAPIPEITSAATATGTVGAVFSPYSISAINGALNYGASGLPAGLLINAETGVISGTPLFAGSYNVTLTAENLSGVGELAAVFTIAKATGTVELSGLSTPYDGSPKTPLATTMPAGLTVAFTFNGSSTVPVEPGAYAVVATIQNANYQGSASATFTITAPVGWSVSTLSAAGLGGVRGLAFDTAGNLYLADATRHVIWKRSTAGVMSVFAGGLDQPGYVNAASTAARFRGPTGLAFDAAGNLYVADTRNQCIRKITTSGTVSLLAGSGNEFDFDWMDGIGAAARFYLPVGLVLAPDGYLYVADSGNGVLRRVDLGTASVSYFDTSAGAFDQPVGLAAAPDGTLFVTTATGNQVWRVGVNGVATRIAGSGFSVAGQSDGTGSNALFDTPSAIVYGADAALYVADTANHTLRRVTTDGVVTTVAGAADQAGATNGFGSVARFYEPTALAKATDGSLYVADLGGEAQPTPTPLLRRATPPSLTPVFDPSPATTLSEGSALTGFTFTATGSPTSFAATGLPPGLVLNPASGALTGTPTESGIYTVTVSAQNGYGTGTLVFDLTVNAPSWTSWRAAAFTAEQLGDVAISGPAADPDGDGIANLMEYLDDRDPLMVDASPYSLELSDGHLTLIYQKLRATSGWRISPEFSSDLSIWHQDAAYVETVSVTTLDARREQVTVRAKAPIEPGSGRYLRLKIENVTGP